MNSKALLIATAALLALSAVSCGNDEEKDTSLSISLSEEVTSDKTTSTESESDSELTTIVSETTIETESNTTIDTTTIESNTSETETTTSEVSQIKDDSQQEQSEQPVENEVSEEPQSPAIQEPEVTEPVTETPTESQPTEPIKFKMEDLLSDASEIIANLGNPNYAGTSESCLSNGLDNKTYQYDGLEIQCYIDGDTEYIYMITILGGDYETDKGIKIGSSRTEVESIYGTGIDSGNMTIYTSGDSEMDIQYSNDIVTSIFFYTPV